MTTASDGHVAIEGVATEEHRPFLSVASSAPASSAFSASSTQLPPSAAPMTPSPLFSLVDLLKATQEETEVPRLRVVDIGAMILADSEDVWRPLVRQGLCESVVGFEPHPDECARLNLLSANDAEGEQHDENEQRGSSGTPFTCSFHFLPWALGDGTLGEFRSCSAAMTSSMLEPNIPLLKLFAQLEEVTTVVGRTPMKTKRLDELLEDLPGGRADFLKLDVQGYELAVLRGATKALENVLVVHTEVEFVEMYQGQPLFAEVDQFLRNCGFIFHRFGPLEGRPMKPLFLRANPLRPISQHLWADAIYVRDLWELSRHSEEELLRTALILHEVYHSYDVVHHVLQKFKPSTAQKYLDLAYSVS